MVVQWEFNGSELQSNILYSKFSCNPNSVIALQHIGLQLQLGQSLWEKITHFYLSLLLCIGLIFGCFGPLGVSWGTDFFGISFNVRAGYLYDYNCYLVIICNARAGEATWVEMEEGMWRILISCKYICLIIQNAFVSICKIFLSVMICNATWVLMEGGMWRILISCHLSEKCTKNSSKNSKTNFKISEASKKGEL